MKVNKTFKTKLGLGLRHTIYVHLTSLHYNVRSWTVVSYVRIEREKGRELIMIPRFFSVVHYFL